MSDKTTGLKLQPDDLKFNNPFKMTGSLIPKEELSPALQPINQPLQKKLDNKDIIDVQYTEVLPLEYSEDPIDYDPSNQIFQITTEPNGTRHINIISRSAVPVHLIQTYEKPEKEQNIQLDLHADSSQPAILRKGFNLLDRIGKMNNQWKENSAYLALSEKAQKQIEQNNNMKMMYRNIAFNNVSGIAIAIQKGHITPDMLNANNGLALNMVIQTGNLDMAETLFRGGVSPHSIDPRNCYTQEMAELIKDEQYKQNNPIVSTLRESIGLPRPKYN